MNLDKVLKIVWLINGVVLIGFLIVAVGVFISEVNFDTASPADYEGYGNKASGDIALSYDDPVKILNQDIFVMGVGYTEGESGSEKLSGLGFYFSSEDRKYFNCVNVIFLDKQYKPIRTLLEKNAFIESFEFPTDYESYDDSDLDTVRNITYLMATSDSNEDGHLGEGDNTDLFISDLDGGNLVKVTSNWEIGEHKVIDNGRKIFMSYYLRNKEAAAAHRKFFALYHIGEKRLEDLVTLQESLDQIEKIIQQ